MSVLIVSNKVDPHADAVIEQLHQIDCPVFRLNTEDLCSGFDLDIRVEKGEMSGSIQSKLRSLDLGSVRSVLYRRPQRPEARAIEDLKVREFAQKEMDTCLHWLWEALRCFWVSKPLSIKRANSKIDQLRIASTIGFEVPRTLITSNPSSALQFIQECGGMAINKVLNDGTIQKDGKMHMVYTHRVTERDLLQLDQVRHMPCVFQERIEKKFELRITVVGTTVFSTEIHSQQSERTREDWRRYDLNNTLHRVHQLPKEVEEACLRLVRHYDLAFGAIDMIVTPDGRYVFLEINPNGQWLWVEWLTGQSVAKTMAQLLAQGAV